MERFGDIRDEFFHRIEVVRLLDDEFSARASARGFVATGTGRTPAEAVEDLCQKVRTRTRKELLTT